MRILKITGIIAAVVVIGYLMLGMLGIGMMMMSGRYDAYELGVLTRRLLIYIAIIVGAIISAIKLGKGLHKPIAKQ
jgi:hypothetical protein